MAYSHRHFRYFMRLLTQHCVLYTEMITTGSLLYGPGQRLLDYHPCEHPLAVQFGGSDPKALAECSLMAADLGYDEINLNVGCPSGRVQNGGIGACLMAQPELVADCIAAIKKRVHIPVSVKTRIGIDQQDSYAELCHFIRTVSQAGCHLFIIHARKAWLQGVSPRQNRNLPPLRYDVVQQLKTDFPHLQIIINGGIKTLDQAKALQQGTDGVMLGRVVCDNPYLLASVDQTFYDVDKPIPSQRAIFDQYLPYIMTQYAQGVKLGPLLKPMVGLFQGVRGAKAWRTWLSEAGTSLEFDCKDLSQALSLVA